MSGPLNCPHSRSRAARHQQAPTALMAAREASPKVLMIISSQHQASQTASTLDTSNLSQNHRQQWHAPPLRRRLTRWLELMLSCLVLMPRCLVTRMPLQPALLDPVPVKICPNSLLRLRRLQCPSVSTLGPGTITLAE